MTVYETPEPITAVVELGRGDLRVVAGDRGDTRVEVRPTDPRRSFDARAAEQVRVEYAAGRLLVRAAKDWRRLSFFSFAGSLEVTVELPAGSDLQANLGMGRIETAGRLARVDLHTGMGPIRVDRVGAAEIDTGHGDVTLERSMGDALVTTGSGAVVLRAVDGRAEVRNSNGEVRVGRASGDVRIKSSNGAVRVEHPGAGVHARCANGAIAVGDVVRGATDVHTALGDVEVGVRRGTSAWMDLHTQYGKVRNSLDGASGPGPGEARAEIRARTAYGDVVVTRSSAGPDGPLDGVRDLPADSAARPARDLPGTGVQDAGPEPPYGLAPIEIAEAAAASDAEPDERP